MEDPVKAIVNAATDEEARQIEQAHLTDGDNGLKPGDPEDQPK